MIDYKWVTGRPTVQLAFITRPRTALNPFVEWPPAQYYFLIWVVGRSRGGAARRTGGMAGREGRENDPARMQLLCALT